MRFAHGVALACTVLLWGQAAFAAVSCAYTGAQVTINRQTSMETTDATACVWTRLDGASGAWVSVFSKCINGCSGAPYATFTLYLDADSDFYAHMGFAVNGTFYASGAYLVWDDYTTWRHICAVVVSSGATTHGLFYLDGVLKEDVNSGSSSAIQYDTDNTSGRYALSPLFAAPYIYSDAAYWTDDLTANEIALMAASRIKGFPRQIRPANLIAYFPLDEFTDGQDAHGLSVKDLIGTTSGSITECNGKAEGFLSYP